MTSRVGGWVALMPGLAAPAQANPKLEEVFQSIQTNVGGSEVDLTRWFALVAAVGAFALCVYTIRRWSQQKATPQAIRNPRKLLREVNRVVPIPARSLKALEQVAEAEGLSSPMVALLCPSILRKLAGRAKTQAERQAVLDLAGTLEKASKR